MPHKETEEELKSNFDCGGGGVLLEICCFVRWGRISTVQTCKALHSIQLVLLVQERNMQKCTVTYLNYFYNMMFVPMLSKKKEKVFAVLID